MVNMISAVAAPCGALASWVSLAQNLGNNFFRADVAWRSRGSRQNLMVCYQESLDKILQEASWLGHGQHITQSFALAVTEAKTVVDGVVANQAAGQKRCMYMLCGTIFPECLDRPLQASKIDFDRIFAHLLLQAQIIEARTTIVESQALPLYFSFDERYVPLHHSEQEILSALEEAGTDRLVVVLSGGPGKGKSSLVRQIGSQYRDRIRSSPGTQVVMLECGQNVDVAAKEMELLRILGGHVSQQSQLEGVNFDVKKVLKNFDVKKVLQRHLSNPDLLIILDDIWEGPLISEFVNLSSGSGSGAKWLLTSQKESIGHSLSPICRCRRFLIKDLSPENAMKILASSAGFGDKKIPQHLHEVASKVIEEAEANPLALATLGAQIANAGRRDLEVWESVRNDLSSLLDSGTPPNVQGVQYPRSFMAAMERSIDDLTCAQKEVLVLISMCRALSVSKHALQFLNNVVTSQGKCSLVIFRTSCSDLESRHLLAKSGIGSTVVSIHSLTKRYVLHRMKDTVKRLETFFNTANSDLKIEASNPSRISVTRILADFFIDTTFRSSALATDSDRSSDQHKKWDKRAILELKRTTSEPIIELLLKVPSRDNGWTEKLGICAQKVLLEFVDNSRLDQESISHLLGSPFAVRPILTFLKDACLLEKSAWDSVEGNSVGPSVGCNSRVPGAFLNLLRDDSCTAPSTALRERAASVVADLCWSHQENSNAFASAPGMLPQLALFLAQVHNTNLQKYAARVLAACAYWDYYCDGSVVQKIVAEFGVVDSLVDLLDKAGDKVQDEQNLSVQIAVAHALSNLVAAKSVVEESLSEHSDPNLRQGRTSLVSGNPRDNLAQQHNGRLLEVLTKSLGIVESPDLQVHACSTLANIAGTNEIETLETLLRFPGLVNKLVSILNENPGENQSQKLQVQAARALCGLATYRDDSHIRQELLQWPGLVEGLAKLLRLENPSLQWNALSAFSHLAFRIEKDTANGLIDHPGLVESLMMLSESQNSNVQAAARAVSVLCSLTDVGDDSLRARIARTPPFLALLTKPILAGEARASEAEIVCLIANLAVTSDDGILDNIAKSVGLVEKLAELLGENHNSSLQGNAIRALLNLAGEENHDDFDVSCFPELLQRLQQALLRSERLRKIRKTVHAVTALTSGRVNRATIPSTI